MNADGWQVFARQPQWFLLRACRVSNSCSARPETLTSSWKRNGMAPKSQFLWFKLRKRLVWNKRSRLIFVWRSTEQSKICHLPKRPTRTISGYEWKPFHTSKGRECLIRPKYIYSFSPLCFSLSPSLSLSLSQQSQPKDRDSTIRALTIFPTVHTTSEPADLGYLTRNCTRPDHPRLEIRWTTPSTRPQSLGH